MRLIAINDGTSKVYLIFFFFFLSFVSTETWFDLDAALAGSLQHLRIC